MRTRCIGSRMKRFCVKPLFKSKIPGKQPLFPGKIKSLIKFSKLNYAILLTAFVRRETFLAAVFL